MAEVKLKNSKKIKVDHLCEIRKKAETKRWQKPTLEDVSEQIMAQPYIRFT